MSKKSSWRSLATALLRVNWRLFYLLIAIPIMGFGWFLLTFPYCIALLVLYVSAVLVCERARSILGPMIQDFYRFRALLGGLRDSIANLESRTAWLSRLHYEKSTPESERAGRQDVTVVCGVKNRCDYRIVNSLKSLRLQDYDQSLINILVVDYDSGPSAASQLKAICDRFGANYVRVENRPEWNRAECLNTGIKQADSRYILLSDVDIIFERNYISTAVRHLASDRYQLIYGKMLDLPEAAVTDEIDIAQTYAQLKTMASYGLSRDTLWYNFYGLSICMVEKEFLREVRGFDETFTLWGCEDDELARRLEWLGIAKCRISDETSFLHQWHPKYEGVSDRSDLKEKIKLNREYFKKSKKLVAAKSCLT